MFNIISDQNDSQNTEILLKNVDCYLRLIQFLTFLSNIQEKRHLYSLFSSTEDKTQVLNYNNMTICYI